MDDYLEQATEGIDHHMAFTAFHLFPAWPFVLNRTRYRYGW